MWGGHCNYRLYSAQPAFLLSSNWKPVQVAVDNCERQCNVKLDGSCIAGRSSRSLSKAGRAREKLTGGAKVTRETCERAGRYDDAILVKVTIASASWHKSRVMMTVLWIAVFSWYLRGKETDNGQEEENSHLATNTCRPKRASCTLESVGSAYVGIVEIGPLHTHSESVIRTSI